MNNLTTGMMLLIVLVAFIAYASLIYWLCVKAVRCVLHAAKAVEEEVRNKQIQWAAVYLSLALLVTGIVL